MSFFNTTYDVENNELFPWLDEYMVNNEEIDDQHMHLVKILNKVHSNVLNDEDDELMKEYLKELVDYTIYHFSEEEKYFNKLSRKARKTHIEIHKEFISKITTFQEQFENNEVRMSVKLMLFLRDWLVNHIEVMDKQDLTSKKIKALMGS